MSRANFHRLLQRYLKGQCSPEEEQLVHHWYDMLDDQDQRMLNEADAALLEDRIWRKICAQTESGMSAIGTGTRGIRPWLVAASVTLLLIATGALFYFRIVCYPVEPSFSGDTPATDVVFVRNDTAVQRNVRLPDKSFVALYPNATLEYPKNFNHKNREVKLTGDAFFAVMANKENPFWVFHEGMITKVLGTKFKIKAPNGVEKGEVIVYSGKVDVFYNIGRKNFVRRILSAPEHVSITTNQKAVLESKHLEETITENPLPITGQMDTRHETFMDIPMPALADTLSQLYALHIKVADGLENITFTGDISGIGLFKQLDIICTVTNTRYEVVGTTIYLERTIN